MAEIIQASINLSKIDKSKIKVVDLKDGTKASFLDITIFINDEKDKYDNIASITISQSKEERESKAAKIYLGNGKQTWQSVSKEQSKPKDEPNAEIDSLPF